MKSQLKIYAENKAEFQETAYQDYRTTVIWMSGENIPAWIYETSYTYVSASVETLDIKAFKNKQISVLTDTALGGGYVVGTSNGYIYAKQQSDHLDEGVIYRLKIYLDTGFEFINYYSDIFQKI